MKGDTFDRDKQFAKFWRRSDQTGYEAQSLLASVRESPEDETNKLAFAQWLEDRDMHVLAAYVANGGYAYEIRQRQLFLGIAEAFKTFSIAVHAALLPVMEAAANAAAEFARNLTAALTEKEDPVESPPPIFQLPPRR